MGASQFVALENAGTSHMRSADNENQTDAVNNGTSGNNNSSRDTDGQGNIVAASGDGNDNGGGSNHQHHRLGTVRDEIEKLSRDPRKRELYRLLQEHMKDQGGDMLQQVGGAGEGKAGTMQNGTSGGVGGGSGGSSIPQRFLDSQRIKTYKTRDDDDDDDDDDDEGEDKMELGEVRREDLGKLLGMELSELRNKRPQITAGDIRGNNDNNEQSTERKSIPPRPCSRDSSVTMTANSPCCSPPPNVDNLQTVCPKKKFLDEFRSRSNSVGSHHGDEETFRYRSNSLSAGLHSRMAHGDTKVVATVLDANEQFRQRCSTVSTSRPTLKKRLLAAAAGGSGGDGGGGGEDGREKISEATPPEEDSTSPKPPPPPATSTATPTASGTAASVSIATTTTSSATKSSSSKQPPMNVKTYIDRIFESEVMKLYLQQDNAADSPPARPLNPQRLQQQVSERRISLGVSFLSLFFFVV